MSITGVFQKLQRPSTALLGRLNTRHAQRRTLHFRKYKDKREAFRHPAERTLPLAKAVTSAKAVALQNTVVTADIFDEHSPPPDRIFKLPPSVTAPSSGRHPHSYLLWQRDLTQYAVNPQDVPPTAASHNYARPMLTYVQVVSVPTADTPGATVMLHFDHRRYAFGRIAEGTQRAFNQRKVGMAKLDEIFVSGPVAWSSVGGLLGMILTIADVVGSSQADVNTLVAPKKKKAPAHESYLQTLKIHGGQNITHMIATARKFIFRKGLPLRMHDIPHDTGTADPSARKPDFEDANVKVWYVSLLPGDTEQPHGRKRSHEDMEDAEEGASTREKNKQLVQAVIDDMFDANWRLDSMVQSMLSMVKLPATIFVRKDGKLHKYEGPMPGEKGFEDIPVLTRTSWPGSRIRDLPPTAPSRQSLSYIVKTHARRGKFNVVAANELGVDKRDFKHAAAGKTVKGKDGIDVTPAMVVDPNIEGRGFAFVDLPDPSYVAAFLARPEWADETIMETVDAMYWNLGKDVLHDERIQKFIKDHPKHHSVFSPDMSPNRIALESPAMQMIKMNKIDPDRFPLPDFNNEIGCVAPNNTFQEGRSMLKQQIAPRVEIQEGEVLPLMDMRSLNIDIPVPIKKLAKTSQQRLQDPAFLATIEANEADIPNRDTEVIPLGTGSSIPSKYRNVSATLVRVPGCGSYLFDAGESTLGQIRRMYGPAKTLEILADLKLIWISHIHADHHLGLVSVIKAWRDATADPAAPPNTLPRLTVASHFTMLDWLREYAAIEDYGYDRLLPSAMRGPYQPESHQTPFIPKPARAAEMGGLVRIDAVTVAHCSGALACKLTWQSGLTVAYSGDCRPSRAFVDMARGATLLLHEATLDDELQADAEAKKHCTMREALGVARRMRARRVLLTHFSQRYPRIPNKLVAGHDDDDDDDGGGGGGDGAVVPDQVVLLAFDQMCVRLGDFRKAELFLPAVRKMLDDEPED